MRIACPFYAEFPNFESGRSRRSHVELALEPPRPRAVHCATSRSEDDGRTLTQCGHVARDARATAFAESRPSRIWRHRRKGGPLSPGSRRAAARIGPASSDVGMLRQKQGICWVAGPDISFSGVDKPWSEATNGPMVEVEAIRRRKWRALIAGVAAGFLLLRMLFIALSLDGALLHHPLVDAFASGSLCASTGGGSDSPDHTSADGHGFCCVSGERVRSSVALLFVPPVAAEPPIEGATLSRAGSAFDGFAPSTIRHAAAWSSRAPCSGTSTTASSPTPTRPSSSPELVRGGVIGKFATPPAPRSPPQSVPAALAAA